MASSSGQKIIQFFTCKQSQHAHVSHLVSSFTHLNRNCTATGVNLSLEQQSMFFEFGATSYRQSAVRSGQLFDLDCLEFRATSPGYHVTVECAAAERFVLLYGAVADVTDSN